MRFCYRLTNLILSFSNSTKRKYASREITLENSMINHMLAVLSRFRSLFTTYSAKINLVLFSLPSNFIITKFRNLNTEISNILLNLKYGI
jgi:hypothetical protein